MTKRLRWLAIGAVLGVAAYVWGTRRAREVVSSEGPGRDALRQAQDGARELGARLREAVGEGLDAMRTRERELERELLEEGR